MELRIAHTSALGAEQRATVRALLDDVFAGKMRDSDWDHALGGLHALIWEEGELVGHASVVQRRLLHAGLALRTGYVEGVAVRADRRRRGYGAAMMNALEEVIRGAYELGALGATADGASLYTHRGWQRWRGKTWALTPEGLVRTTSDDADVYVLEAGAELDPEGDLVCDWRDGDLW